VPESFVLGEARSLGLHEQEEHIVISRDLDREHSSQEEAAAAAAA